MTRAALVLTLLATSCAHAAPRPPQPTIPAVTLPEDDRILVCVPTALCATAREVKDFIGTRKL